MISLLSILALGLADRIRGSGWFKYNKPIGAVLMGLVMASMLRVDGWMFLYVVVAVFAGTKPGLGGLEEFFDHRGKFSGIIVRAIIWGIYLAPISIVAAIASFLGFCISVVITRDLPYKGDKWAWMEFSRGALVAFLIITMG